MPTDPIGDGLPLRAKPRSGRVMRAYFLILSRLYGIVEGLDHPIVRIVPDLETELDRYFRMKPDFRFVRVRRLGALEQLSDQDRSGILEHLTEPEILREILPPEQFELSGFTMIQAVDVTQSEVISSLQSDLIDRESMFCQEGFMRLRRNLRTLFGKPGMMAGTAAIQGDQVLLMQKGCDMVHSC